MVCILGLSKISLDLLELNHLNSFEISGKLEACLVDPLPGRMTWEPKKPPRRAECQLSSMVSRSRLQRTAWLSFTEDDASKAGVV